jgi:hypothetical protein
VVGLRHRAVFPNLFVNTLPRVSDRSRVNVLENRRDFDDGFPVGCLSLYETEQQMATSMFDVESSEMEERLLKHALFANPRYCRAR